MPVGFGALLSKDSVNQAAGRLAVQLRETFELVDQFNTWHAGVGAAGLQADFGFTSGEAAIIGSAIADFEQLRQIYLGNSDLTVAKNFRAFSDDLEGLR